ncbi:hypothetical protein [Nocardia sp. NPDC052566]|uniref:hypothetical protein n=1 Tax=Nocardia sp. NPDC052566 TaxID=3364330 RepID=UPI0037CBA159
MSWPEPRRATTDPAYYHDAADDTERQLRADFTLHYQLRQIAPHGESPRQTKTFNDQADALAAKWGRHEQPRCRSLWARLQGAIAGWEARPEPTRRAFNQIENARRSGELGIDDEIWRTLRQAREITGHAEPVISQSKQDGARWRPPASPKLQLVTDTGTRERSSAPEPRRSLLDRALGAPGASIPTDAEVAAIIAETDEALDIEEQHGDLDTGHDARTALLPRTVREAPVAYDGDRETQTRTQIAALRTVQDLTAEHARATGGFTAETSHDQAVIGRLEALLDGIRSARRTAIAAGVEAVDIDAAYRAGLDGTYWSHRPSHQLLGHIDRLTEERDRARAEADTLHDQQTVPGAEPDHEAAPDGSRIGAVIDAALPGDTVEAWPTDTEPTPESHHDYSVGVGDELHL